MIETSVTQEIVTEVLPLFLITIALRRKIKWEERPEVPEEELEIDHKIPKSKGGSDLRSNLEALTKIEHCIKHYQDGEYDAVNLIVSRMTPTEFKVWCRIRRTIKNG